MQNQYEKIWSNLPVEARSEFEQSSKVLEFKRGERIYLQGEEPRGLYFIKSGLVGLVISGAASGKEHLVRFFKNGQFFGHRALFSSEGYHGTTTALEPTVIRMIPKDVVVKVLDQHPQLYKDIVEVLAKELRQSEVQHVMILENQILARTAQALIYLKELQPDHRWTRQEIANFCASTVSTIIKALAELESLGLIRQDGRDIIVLNRDKLIALQDSDI